MTVMLVKATDCLKCCQFRYQLAVFHISTPLKGLSPWEQNFFILLDEQVIPFVKRIILYITMIISEM